MTCTRHTPYSSQRDDNDNSNNNTHLFSLLSVNKFKSFLLHLPYKHMVNASSCTVELSIHLKDVLGGLLSKQELEVYFIDVISVLNGNM